MGNRMSQYGGDGPAQLDYDEHSSEPHNSGLPYLRGGDVAQTLRDGTGGNGRSAPTAPRLEYGRLSPAAPEEAVENGCYEVPATEFYASQGSRRLNHAGDTIPSRHVATNESSFDFNDAQQPNPWLGAQPQQRRTPESEHVVAAESQPDFEIEVRRFAECRDKNLRAYLAARSISFGFLAEIDQFLRGHPEIATCAEGRSTLRQLTELPPLEAYKYFLKGYTRPARYVEGVIRTDAFIVPMDFTYQSLSSKRDPELTEFFDGFDYRHDIIEKIDKEVYTGMQELVNGRQISLALHAYKYFEYSYQNEYMPHRYLPEHVVLNHVPKPHDYTEPRPCVLSGYKKHGDVRARMARANDQGVDVLEVLIAEYRHALIRKAHRRIEIDDLVTMAKQRLEKERRNPTGVDIVDFIMDDAFSRQGTNRPRVPRTNYRRNHKGFIPGFYHISLNDTRVHQNTHTLTRVQKRRAPGFLRAQAAELGQAKATLLRLYAQEQHTIHNSRGANARNSTINLIRASRASAERRYVNCLIRYCRNANCMSAAEATQLQKHSTRERMSNLELSHSSYLLSMYPRELN